MKKKKSKKIGTMAIGAALAVSCILSPMAAAEEVPAEAEVTTAITQPAELEEAILNEVLPVEPTTEETTTEPNTEGTTNPAPQVEETDKSMLIEVVKEFESMMEQIQPEWMTQASYQKMVDALANAKKVLENDAATQDEIDAVQDEILDAISGMQLTEQGVVGMIKVTFNEIEKQIPGSQEFTKESWNAYLEAKEVLMNLFKASNASLEDIVMAFDDYMFAIDALEPLSEIETLREYAESSLEKAKAAIAKSEKYTKESLAAVKDALPALEAALAKEDVDFDELKAAYNEMDKALAALKAVTAEPTTKPTTKPSTSDSDNPKTGDDRNLFPIGLAGSVSLAVMGAMVLLKKKKAGENE